MSFPVHRRMVVFNGLYSQISPEWQAALFEAGFYSDREWSSLSPGEAVSTSTQTNCFRVQTSQGSVYFKRYCYVGRHRWRYFLRPSRACCEVWSYRQIHKLNIPTLEVIALQEKRRLGQLISACIITKAIENSCNLVEYATRIWNRLTIEERHKQYREIRRALCQQVQRAHGANFFHHDLHWRNILIRRSDTSFEPVWIDCPRGRFRRFLQRRYGQLVDFSCLAELAFCFLSKTERWRALSLFLNENDQQIHRRLFREIEYRRRKSNRPRRPKSIFQLFASNLKPY